MIFYIMGKSATGKDTLYKKLLTENLMLKTVPIYTTRPKRDGETDGHEYNFVSEKYLDEHKNKIIEKRVYNTVFGPWYYATLDDGTIKSGSNYLIIGTLESYNAVKKYYGVDKVFPIYLEVSNDVRRTRAMKRESLQKVPKFDEMERRFRADEIDFCEENIKAVGINKRYNADNFDICVPQIISDIKNIIGQEDPQN
ncbi:MAG: guanylate kinase [Lachnospiraceae bacterium]|nr:guanylate kinase [Lachnospiraceae bacterium]